MLKSTARSARASSSEWRERLRVPGDRDHVAHPAVQDAGGLRELGVRLAPLLVPVLDLRMTKLGHLHLSIQAGPCPCGDRGELVVAPATTAEPAAITAVHKASMAPRVCAASCAPLGGCFDRFESGPKAHASRRTWVVRD
ncbi:hypothetical protein [Streptomyces sp. NPDC002602]|uniref:hypothetical protein n=1 Tax=Streptomyces sp. NPDC002602 TaxID=3364654 RepID=UPI003685D185